MGDERGTVGHRLLCPEIVGRSGEVARLRDRVEALGRGRVVVLES